ncbi:hypothetical protein [Pelotomaculum propionicicum]|uniref:hypothetical protein n=1 Tax=Pelotomaculum propionicicum TaxID=258475 RepID=UPI003BA1A070
MAGEMGILVVENQVLRSFQVVKIKLARKKAERAKAVFRKNIFLNSFKKDMTYT